MSSGLGKLEEDALTLQSANGCYLPLVISKIPFSHASPASFSPVQNFLRCSTEAPIIWLFLRIYRADAVPL